MLSNYHKHRIFWKTACCDYYWYSNFQRSAQNLPIYVENHMKIHLKSYKMFWFAFIFFSFHNLLTFLLYNCNVHCAICFVAKKLILCLKKTFTGRKGSSLTGSSMGPFIYYVNFCLFSVLFSTFQFFGWLLSTNFYLFNTKNMLT